MIKFNDHHKLEGTHAYLSASKYSWVNYDDEHFIKTYRNSQAAELGTKIHALAAELISFKQHLPEERKTLNMHVNDAIDLEMSPEVVLYYSPYAYGTSDAISYDPENHFLRIHDLKTGTIPAKMTQLYVYASLFCLEYDLFPTEIKSEFRIYQNDEVFVDPTPDVDKISHIMDKIVHFDDLINQMRLEAGGIKM